MNVRRWIWTIHSTYKWCTQSTAQPAACNISVVKCSQCETINAHHIIPQTGGSALQMPLQWISASYIRFGTDQHDPQWVIHKAFSVTWRPATCAVSTVAWMLHDARVFKFCRMIVKVLKEIHELFYIDCIITMGTKSSHGSHRYFVFACLHLWAVLV
jgi:hypothetical protein